MSSLNGSGTDQVGEITPEERARLDASVRGLEQAPSTRQQVGKSINWAQIQNALGEPFNNERIPLNRLRLMRRDPIIGFGLHFIKTPLVRAPWYIHSLDPMVAAFLDAALRPIMARLIVQHLQQLEFGFQAMAKRFQYAVPEGTYIDPVSKEEKNVWETYPGNVVPVIPKAYVALPPESVTPIFDDSTGEFNGINFKPPEGTGGSGSGGRSKGSGGSEGSVEIDLYHSLWVTNEKDSVFGNIYGYPRLGYVYPYWWSYWMRWAVADRAFERKGDPATLVRYPEGEIQLGSGQTIRNSEYALMIAERIRSGAGIAMPSTPYIGLDDKPSTVSEWSIEFLDAKVDSDLFGKDFSYIDTQKLRGLFVPEQALIEGSGGTSSRNVAAEMGSALVESQSVMMSEFVQMVNRFVIPHLIISNFPDLWDQGVRAEMKTRGFAAKDMDFLQQIVQLVGQADPDRLGVDIRKALEDMDVPLTSYAEYQQLLADKAAQAAAAGPGEVAPTTESAGVVPTPGNAPSTEANSPASGSATGFTYVPAVERIEFSRADEYSSDLPSTMHYKDSSVRALSKQLWNAVHDLYSDEYADFSRFLDEYDADQLHLSDEEEGVELAPSDFVRDWARRVVKQWSEKTFEQGLERYNSTVDRTRSIIRKIVARAGAVARREAQLEVQLSDETSGDWVENRVTDMVSKTISTTRTELEDFVANFIADGEFDPVVVSKAIQAHFSDFPAWKADRYARTETRDAVNAGILFTGQVNNLQVAQAVDAQYGETDADCEDRDGEFFTISQALDEVEHPNGTLGWRLVHEPVTLSIVDEISPDVSSLNGAQGYWDRENHVVYLTRDIDVDDRREFLRRIGDELS